MWKDGLSTVTYSALYLFIAILSLGIIYFKRAFSYFDKLNIPTLKPSIPFGNCAPQILLTKASGEHIRNLYRKLKPCGKPCAGFYLFTKPMVLILDPELCKHVMAKDFPHFYARETHCDEENDPLSGHLVSISGIKWRNLRTKLTPTFSSGKMKMMFHTLVKCSEELDSELIQIVKKGQPIDIKDLMGRFTTDIIGSCAFGLECNSIKNPDNEFRQVGRRIFNLSNFDAIKVLLSNYFPRFYRALRVKRLPRYIHDFFMNIVRDTVNYREKHNIIRNDFMQLLIQLKNRGTIEDDEEMQEPGKRLTMDEIAAQAFVFFLAGFETSSTTMSFFMYDMAVNQDIQDKVRNEINEVLQTHDGQITYESISDMTYFDKVIHESMRLHSIIPSLVRKCTKNYDVPNSDMRIEKGTAIVIPAYGFHTDPQYYPNPEMFDPERFSTEEKAKRHPFTFIPFGEGPRICIGLRFGFMQTKVGLATLLRNYRYTLSSKTRIPLVHDPRCNIFSVLGGIWMEAEPLSHDM